MADTTARRLAELLAREGLTLATAESCTGGLIGATLTDIPGSSGWYLGGVVAYANSVKTGLLEVDPALIETHGAVSEEVVRAMALGVRRAAGASAAMAVSGVAGPGGGTSEKPVGTVWIGWSLNEAGTPATRAQRFLFPGDRAAVRQASVQAALAGLVDWIEESA